MINTAQFFCIDCISYPINFLERRAAFGKQKLKQHNFNTVYIYNLSTDIQFVGNSFKTACLRFFFLGDTCEGLEFKVRILALPGLVFATRIFSLEVSLLNLLKLLCNGQVRIQGR